MKDKKLNLVFGISLAITLVIVLWAIIGNKSFVNAANQIFFLCTQKFGWLYLLSMTFFVAFVFFVAFSKWGNIRLGEDDSRPEYSSISWFAMLFTAGMGVGLIFWGIGEPLSHYMAPDGTIAPGSIEAAEFAIKSSFMHWGIHPWAGYAVVGLGLAYFQFRKGYPALVSSVSKSLSNGKNSTVLGNILDILAVFATVAGVVTSLGLGVLQINSGLNYLFKIPNNLSVQIIIIISISVIFILSAVKGIDKGIKKLSNLNLLLALAVLIMAVIIGPKLEMVNNLVNGCGMYISSFIKDSFSIHTYGDNSWIENWRIFYWAWWIAWAPFVGIFIARISKGRTIREFIIGGVVVPSLGSIVWFAIFGTMGIDLGMNGKISEQVLQEIVQKPETGLFYVMEQYPFGMLLSILIMILLCIFFVTSADSGIFVLSMLTSKGDLNPRNGKKILWGIVLILMAIGLLIAGGLKPLQTISIAAAFPFIFVMFLICASLWKSLKKES